MEKRNEIDGLRSVAVLPVILFHAGFDSFSGGFIGVDVFFVISGYLITTIIYEEARNGTFSILRFYERRIRRIFPALFLVSATCIPFAWMWMPAAQFKDFSQSLVAVNLFASNVLFWRESGYFGGAAELKPLLHTWSLSVEEQFYLFFPPLLLLCKGLNRMTLLIAMSAISLLSLGLAQYASESHPRANFYLLPTRAWELGVGAIIAVSAPKWQWINSRLGASLAALGLGMVIFGVFQFDHSTPFPSFWACIPVFGTGLVIAFARPTNTTGKLLSWGPFVGIGLISYSAYLWHQPLFAFARIRLSEEPGDLLMGMLSILSLALAAFTWRTVEQPFREQILFTRRAIFSGSLSIAGLMIAIGITGHLKNGFEFVPVIENTWEANVDNSLFMAEDFYIIGDSHAEHLISGIKGITTGKVEDLSSPGCIPLRNVDRYDSRFEKGRCAEKMNSFLDRIIASDPTGIILLSTMGPVYLEGTAFKGKDMARVTGLGVELITNQDLKDRWKVFEIGLRETLADLDGLQNGTVVFAVDVPELGIHQGCLRARKRIDFGPFAITDNIKEIECFVPREEYNQRSMRYKNLVYAISSDFPRILLFDPTNLFCDDQKCRGFDPKYRHLYRDYDHLSKSGSLFYATGLAKFLRNEIHSVKKIKRKTNLPNENFLKKVQMDN